MKKVFTSRIFAFILGAVIFSSITVAAHTIFANDIGYTPKDTTWKKSNGEDITNVKDAIDELYNKASARSEELNITLYQDLSENDNIRRRTTITKTFTAEANTIYYILGVYSWSTSNPSVNQKILHIGDDFGAITSFSSNVEVLDSNTSPFIKIKTNDAGTVTINMNASASNSSEADSLFLQIYK